MPRYELMYILSSSVSDDQVAEVTGQIQQFVSDFGGTEITETQLGKKKLAYPIKKTRNGVYVVVNARFQKEMNLELDRFMKLEESVLRHMILRDED